MGMESIVKCIQHRITPMESEKGEINITRVFHKDDYESLDAVITALENGKKYKQIIKDIKNIEFSPEDDCSTTWYQSGKTELDNFEGIVDFIEQKYFPK